MLLLVWHRRAKMVQRQWYIGDIYLHYTCVRVHLQGINVLPQQEITCTGHVLCGLFRNVCSSNTLT